MSFFDYVETTLYYWERSRCLLFFYHKSVSYFLDQLADYSSETIYPAHHSSLTCSSFDSINRYWKIAVISSLVWVEDEVSSLWSIPSRVETKDIERKYWKNQNGFERTKQSHRKTQKRCTTGHEQPGRNATYKSWSFGRTAVWDGSMSWVRLRCFSFGIDGVTDTQCVLSFHTSSKIIILACLYCSKLCFGITRFVHGRWFVLHGSYVVELLNVHGWFWFVHCCIFCGK